MSAKVGGGLGRLLLEPLAENFVKRVFWDTVDAPRPGSVVYCGFLFGQAEHSGIYVGKNRIVSLASTGEIVKQSPEEFLDGLTTGDTIYVSCKGKSPVGDADVAKRARRKVGHHRDYNVVLNNCHQFTSGCLTGEFENADNLLETLQDTAASVLGADTWRAWEDP